MFRVLIVDDEPKFRAYLQQVINWREHGFEICGEAKNGAEALDLAAETLPDIALLDINMPILDGITLAEKLKEMRREISVVMITGHSEFAYARKALQLGVEDYLLKPFNKEELLSALAKARAKLEKTLEDQEQARDDIFFLRERFLNMLIGDEYNIADEETGRIFKRLGIDLYSSHLFAVAAIEIDHMYQLWTAAAEISHWKAQVVDLTRETVENKWNHLIFNGTGGKIISIVNFPDEKALGDFSPELYQKICSLVKIQLGFTITIGMGRPVKGFNEIRKSYTEAIIALQNKLDEECWQVMEYAALIGGDRTAGFYRLDINDKMMMALRMNDLDEIRRDLQQVFDYIKQNRLLLNYTNTIVIGLISICLSYITEVGGSIENILGSDFSPYPDIKNNTSLETTFNWLFDIFVKTAENLSKIRKTRAKKIIDGVKEYIQKNYMDNELSVERIAHNIYLDSSYIRRVFAKELDTTVTDYLTNIRLQKARELLCSGNIKLAEISEMVGYSDAGYFSKCFKKKFGVSPSEIHVKTVH